eukprot:316482-Amphidinium_carterae.3
MMFIDTDIGFNAADVIAMLQLGKVRGPERYSLTRYAKRATHIGSNHQEIRVFRVNASAGCHSSSLSTEV